MGYIQVGRETLVDTKTYKLVTVGDLLSLPPQSVAVPFYLFTHGGAAEWVEDGVKTLLKGWNRELESCLYLNKLNIDVKIDLDGLRVNMKFFDNLKDEWVKITMRVVSFHHDTSVDVAGADYDIRINKAVGKYHHNMTQPPWGIPMFRNMYGLCHFRLDLEHYDWFPFGILPNQYQVHYKGHQMGGSCYALLLGPAAVLMDDDLQFDSLVFLNGVKGPIKGKSETYDIDVGRFMYTANRYVVKFITLAK